MVFEAQPGVVLPPVQNVPVSWDSTNNAGILWKIPNPAPGFSSPIVWQDKIYLSGASEAEQLVFCFEWGSGQAVWRASQNFASAIKKDDAITLANIAAPTPVTDGQRIYAFFGSGDLLTFTTAGQLAWKKSFGPLKNQYGHASPPTFCSDKLILQIDQGEAEQSLSRLYALDPRTGQTKWQASRKVGSSWATPLVVSSAGKHQIVTAAVPHAISYDSENGLEIWRVEGLNGEVTPSPIQAANLVVVVSPSEKWMEFVRMGAGM